MNWFSIVEMILALSPTIVNAVEEFAGVAQANGKKPTSADKAAVGITLGTAAVALAGGATGNIPVDQVAQTIKAINDKTVADMNAQKSPSPTPAA